MGILLGCALLVVAPQRPFHQRAARLHAQTGAATFRLYLPGVLRNSHLPAAPPPQAASGPSPTPTSVSAPGQPLGLYSYCRTREERYDAGELVPSSVTTTWYNGFSLPLKYEQLHQDHSSPDQVTRSWYGADGRLLRTVFDVRRDGIIDGGSVRSYDAVGQLIRVEIDDDGDGVWDDITGRAYDAAHRLVTMTEDKDADGVVDEQWEFSYDVENRLMETLHRWIRYGTTTRETITWEGSLPIRVDSYGADGIRAGFTTLDYNAEHRLERVDYYGTGDALTQWETYAYSERGDLTAMEVHVVGSHEVDSMRWSHDGRGRPVTMHVESHYGAYDVAYQYNCPLISAHTLPAGDRSAVELVRGLRGRLAPHALTRLDGDGRDASLETRWPSYAQL